MQKIELPYNRHHWVADQEERPMSVAQITQVAFQADNALCKILGMHEQGRRGWVDLSDEQRIDWMEKGPTNDPTRVAIYKAVMAVLRPMAK